MNPALAASRLGSVAVLLAVLILCFAAAAIRFLLEQEWITGQVLGVDGGLSSVFVRTL